MNNAMPRQKTGFPFQFALLVLIAGIPDAVLSAPVQAQTVIRSETGAVRVTEIVCGLEHPWALAFLPENRLLVTERPGRMRILSMAGASSAASVSAPLAGVPEVYARGQGGLLDVALAPDFETSGAIFFSYAEPTAKGARTAVARATLDAGSLRLRDVRRIFAQRDDPPGGNHWGARLVFDAGGRLFVTLGDRYDHRDKAQDLGSHLGKIVRIEAGGGAAAENPFIGRPGALPEIWSYGHRNVQGAALDPANGELWISEHGPQGGDEVNRVLPGRNYGWPVITYGREYVTGFRIGEGSERADVESPLLQWAPSIAPSGMAFYTGDVYPGWKGSVFAGALKAQMLVRLQREGGRIVREERFSLGKRIRDVRQGPDGRLWLLDDSDGCVLRLDPA